MPFKSKAQRRKFAELLMKGEISDETFEEWNRETGGAKLPEYAGSKTTRGAKSKQKKSRPSVKRKAKSRSKTKRKATTKSRRTRK
jgi:hypothetical protein